MWQRVVCACLCMPAVVVQRRHIHSQSGSSSLGDFNDFERFEGEAQISTPTRIGSWRAEQPKARNKPFRLFRGPWVRHVTRPGDMLGSDLLVFRGRKRLCLRRCSAAVQGFEVPYKPISRHPVLPVLLTLGHEGAAQIPQCTISTSMCGYVLGIGYTS